VKRLKKKKNEDEEKTSFIETFKYLYKTYPGMKSLIILLLYGLLFTMLISVVALNQNNYNDEESSTPEVEETTNLTYKEMLDNLIANNSNIKYTIVINDITYYLDTIYEDNILTGTYEDSLGSIHKFKIKNDNVYEISMSNETLNNELFSNINIDYIIPTHLVNILENNKSIKTKEEDNMIYSYDIDNYKYLVYINNNIYKIEIKDNLNTYTIEFE